MSTSASISTAASTWSEPDSSEGSGSSVAHAGGDTGDSNSVDTDASVDVDASASLDVDGSLGVGVDTSLGSDGGTPSVVAGSSGGSVDTGGSVGVDVASSVGVDASAGTDSSTWWSSLSSMWSRSGSSEGSVGGDTPAPGNMASSTSGGAGSAAQMSQPPETPSPTTEMPSSMTASPDDGVTPTKIPMPSTEAPGANPGSDVEKDSSVATDGSVNTDVSAQTDAPTSTTPGISSGSTTSATSEPSNPDGDATQAPVPGVTIRNTDGGSSAAIAGQWVLIKPWQQCGGMNFDYSSYVSGDVFTDSLAKLGCTAGNKCVDVNPWYFQCQPPTFLVTKRAVEKASITRATGSGHFRTGMILR
ncbi:hypothetical protein BBJ29_007713 [Phytophthora kernoviae]|nr:hypothetical protein BBJ29_007713 [Phytophthora kernoviae]